MIPVWSVHGLFLGLCNLSVAQMASTTSISGSGSRVVELLACLQLASCACRLLCTASLSASLLKSRQPQAAKGRHLSPCSLTSRMPSFRCTDIQE